jgi:phage shock protein A
MYEALFEDEGDIFGGTPKSKFMDVVFNANNDIVRAELEKFFEKAAVMEAMLEEQHGDNLDREIAKYQIEHQDEVDARLKSLYIEVMGEILSQSE